MKKRFLKSMVMVGVVAIWGLFSTAYCDHHDLNEDPQQGRAQQAQAQQPQVDEVNPEDPQHGRAQQAQAQQPQVDEVNPEDPQFQQQAQAQQPIREEVQNAQREMEEAVRPELEANIREFNANPEPFVQAFEADARGGGQEIGNDMARGLEDEVGQVMEANLGRDVERLAE